MNAPQGDGSTALHWAAHLDDAALVDYLIESGARVDPANDLGVTPLYISCTNHRRHRAPAEGGRQRERGAAQRRDRADELRPHRRRRRGPRAAGEGGAGQDKESTHDQTALMWAAAQRQAEAVAALVKAGADLRARSRVYEQTVTSEVTQRAGREALNYTVRRGGMTPLLFAARSGDVESARLLVGAGADTNEVLPDGTPALTLAAYSGHGTWRRCCSRAAPIRTPRRSATPRSMPRFCASIRSWYARS